MFRITPAYAGKSDFRVLNNNAEQDHPRLCGEKFRKSLFQKSMKGSPPPMRGKVFSAPELLENLRITPAYAGKSVGSGRNQKHNRDHPRLCGEKGLLYRNPVHHVGSPPPMRGKDFEQSEILMNIRITPAYAGKSSISCSTSCVQ